MLSCVAVVGFDVGRSRVRCGAHDAVVAKIEPSWRASSTRSPSRSWCWSLQRAMNRSQRLDSFVSRSTHLHLVHEVIIAGCFVSLVQIRRCRRRRANQLPPHRAAWIVAVAARAQSREWSWRIEMFFPGASPFVSRSADFVRVVVMRGLRASASPSHFACDLRERLFKSRRFFDPERSRSSQKLTTSASPETANSTLNWQLATGNCARRIGPRRVPS